MAYPHGTTGKTMYDYPEVFQSQGMALGHFGCIMLDLEEVPVDDILGVTAYDLEHDDHPYYFATNPLLRYAKGPVAEEKAHATLLYGLTPDDLAGHAQRDNVDLLLQGLDLSAVQVHHVDAFPGQFGEPYYCVVAHLDTTVGDLAEANRRLRWLPHIDSFLEYRAHVTLAYVRVEEMSWVIDRLEAALAGSTLQARGINYGGELK